MGVGRAWVAMAALAIVGAGSPAGAAPEANEASLHGVVRDAAGRPVAHVLVRCAGAFAGQEGPRIADVTTDAEGRYEVRGLAPGDVSVMLLSELGVGHGSDLKLSWREPVVRDFTIHGELELEGRVTTKEAGPFDVELDRLEDVGAGAWHAATARRARLPADGSFRFAALRHGAYALRVLEGRFARVERKLDLFAPTRGLEVALPAAPRGSVRVKPVSTWPEKASWRSVWMLPEGGSPADSRYGEEKDGVFPFDRLAAGAWWVQVRHVFGEMEESRSEDRWFPVTVGDGEQTITPSCGPAEDVRLVLLPPKGRRSVEGRVVLVHGPFEAATPFRARREVDGTVAVWRVPEGYPGMPPGLRQAPKPADALPLEGLAKGTRRVRIEALGCTTVERTLEVLGPMRVEIALDGIPGREAVVLKGATDRLEHVRVDARRDEPGAVWTEILWRRDWPRMSHGAVPGTFRAFLARGRWKVRASCDKLADVELPPIEVASEGPPIELSFPWGPGVAVSGTVTVHRVPVSEGWLYPQRLEDGVWRAVPAKETSLDGEGGYRVEGLSPGRWRFTASPKGLPVLGEVTIEPGARDVTLDLAFPSVEPSQPR